MSNSNSAALDTWIKEFSRKKVKKGTVLINREGSAKKSPKCPNCGSWIRHWETLSDNGAPSDGNCAVVDCNGKTEDDKPAEIVGCHVMIKDATDKKVYIAPLCACCNNKADGTELVLSRDVTLVRANVQETCGKLK